MDQESAAEDSNLCGFDSDGSAVSAGNLPAENLRTRNSYRKAQRQVEASDLPTVLPGSCLPPRRIHNGHGPIQTLLHGCRKIEF